MSTGKNEFCLILERHGVRPTANRLLVYCALKTASKAVSLGELEIMLETIDKSSISRTLAILLEHHLLHSMEDGEGVVKYELCTGEDDCSVDDMHPHFYCESCRKVICLKSVRIPVVQISDGCIVNSINYMIKGLCPECARRLDREK